MTRAHVSVQIVTKTRHKVKAKATRAIASLLYGVIILPLSTGIHFWHENSFEISRIKWELEESTDFRKHGNSKIVQFSLLDVVTQVINVIDNRMRWANFGYNWFDCGHVTHFFLVNSWFSCDVIIFQNKKISICVKF